VVTLESLFALPTSKEGKEKQARLGLKPYRREEKGNKTVKPLKPIYIEEEEKKEARIPRLKNLKWTI